MKKTSFQIQQYCDCCKWIKITHKINSPQKQNEIMMKILQGDNEAIKSGILCAEYAPIYRMRLRDKSWFYFSTNPYFIIKNGKLIM